MCLNIFNFDVENTNAMYQSTIFFGKFVLPTNAETHGFVRDFDVQISRYFA